MTLQQIADYAMNYLDSKGIAADYVVEDRHFDLFAPYSKGETKQIKYRVILVLFLDLEVELNILHGMNAVKTVIDLHLNNPK